MAYTTQDADDAQARTDAAREYNRDAARRAKALYEEAIKHRRVSDEARENVTGRSPRGVIASGDN